MENLKYIKDYEKVIKYATQAGIHDFLEAIRKEPTDKLHFAGMADYLREQGYEDLANFIQHHTTDHEHPGYTENLDESGGEHKPTVTPHVNLSNLRLNGVGLSVFNNHRDFFTGEDPLNKGDVNHYYSRDGIPVFSNIGLGENSYLRLYYHNQQPTKQHIVDSLNTIFPNNSTLRPPEEDITV